MTPEDQKQLLSAIGKYVREQIDVALKNFGYRGAWHDGTEYKRGNFVTHDGSLFHCNLDTKTRPGKDPVSWSLCCKRGQDGKDRAA